MTLINIDPQSLGELIADMVLKAALPLKAQLDDKLSYRGTWQSSCVYKRADVVTLGGQLWHANKDDTQSRPGTDHDWQLMSKVQP